MIVPDFLTSEATHNRRKLIALSELDVNRDILSLRFMLKSEINPEDIKYYLELISWTETNMEIFVNFTDPLIVSKGNNQDRIVCMIKNKHLFQAKYSNEKLQSERIYI